MSTAIRSRTSQGGQGPARRKKGPLDPRLVQRAAATRWYLAGGVVVGILMAVLTIVQAWLIASAVTDVFHTRSPDGLIEAAVGLAAVFLGKSVLVWLNTYWAQRASAAVKSQLRMDIMRARLERPVDSTASTASLITLVTQGLDALDGFYSKYLPQLVLAATVPFIIGAAILWADWTSALVVVLTLPLIPIFMMLVGWTTEARTRKRWRLQTRLARHFSDLVIGLPTLQVFGRARAQAEGLRRSEEAHRKETVATLRISFVSAFVLELLATISVAIVAVSIGLRVVAGHLDLYTALFVLVLAPEAYLPVRQVGVHYHDAADGMAASESAFALIDGSSESAPGGESQHSVDPDGPLVRVSEFSHLYPGSDAPASGEVSFDVRPGEFVALTGPSGGGKTTILHALMGFLTPTHGTVVIPPREQIAYVGQEPGMINGTVADNVRLGQPYVTDAEARTALDRAGAPDLTLDHPVGDEGVGLSAGERRRVATARALLRIENGARLLILDEPTAGLDADAEAVLLRSLRDLEVAAVVVSHRSAVINEADRVITVAAPDLVASDLDADLEGVES